MDAGESEGERLDIGVDGKRSVKCSLHGTYEVGEL